MFFNMKKIDMLTLLGSFQQESLESVTLNVIIKESVLDLELGGQLFNPQLSPTNYLCMFMQ